MVDFRTTWCGVHWLGWVSFGTLIIGVACLMTAIALPNFYTNTYSNGFTAYLGLWNFCYNQKWDQTWAGKDSSFTSLACFPVDTSCNSWDGGAVMTSNCSQYHAITAVLFLACVSGGLAIFVNWAALAIMLAHGSISTFVVKMGGFILSAISGGLGLLAMILVLNEKDNIFPKTGANVTLHASFGVLVVGWVFVLISAITFGISARRCGGGFKTDEPLGATADD